MLNSTKNLPLFTLIFIAALASCTAKKQLTNNVKPIKQNTVVVVQPNEIENFAQQTIFNDSNFNAAHIGISIYNTATNSYLYNYQGDKYFIPASNTKIATCFAALKNLGDSLVGLKIKEYSNSLVGFASGDPTLLHADYTNQPVINFIKNSTKKVLINTDGWNEKAWGNGWAWNDFDADYMPERSALPLYGNVIQFSGTKNDLQVMPASITEQKDFPIYRTNKTNGFVNDVSRNLFSNEFSLQLNGTKKSIVEVPFITSSNLSIALLETATNTSLLNANATLINNPEPEKKYNIYSQPTDSMLKPMMHRSDNFFAEQTLLMVSNEKLGIMNDAAIIDTLLKTDFKGIPQKPRWVDGSGLSRYNMFTPQSFVWILNSMKNQFEWNRITNILATGNSGTLNNYYKELNGKIFAKTGTLTGQVALSGYLVTAKNNTLVFSVLVNNHQTSATNIRRAVEAFLLKIYAAN